MQKFLWQPPGINNGTQAGINITFDINMRFLISGNFIALYLITKRFISIKNV